MDPAPVLVSVAYRHDRGLVCVTGLLMDVSASGLEVAFEDDERLWTEEEGEVVVISVVTDKGALGALARALPASLGSGNLRRFGFASRDGSLQRWFADRRGPLAGPALSIVADAPPDLAESPSPQSSAQPDHAQPDHAQPEADDRAGEPRRRLSPVGRRDRP